MFTIAELTAAAGNLGYTVEAAYDPMAGAHAIVLVTSSQTYGTFVSLVDAETVDEDGRAAVERANEEALAAALRELLNQAGVELAVLSMAERIVAEQ